MRYKPFGKTGMNISEMALGTWGIGGSGWDTYSDAERLDAICAAIDCGVNLIDTAPAYNGGEAERYIGQALQQTGRRNEVFIATKCGTDYIDGAYVRNASPENIVRECEESLRNLRTDHIDLYLLHWPDGKTPIPEIIGAMVKLREQGKIAHIGVCNFTEEQLAEAETVCPIEALQLQYSMLNRKAEQRMQNAAQKGAGIMAYGTLGGGILSGAYRSLREFDAGDSRNRFYPFFKEPTFSYVQEVLAVMDEISAANGHPLAQIALNETARKGFTCLVGAQTRRKVEQNAAAFAWSLTDEELAKLEAAVARFEAQIAN